MIESFKNAHPGERVWIIGNGPSAEHWTMDELRSLGGVVMGTNRCWRTSPRTGAFFQETEYHTFVAGHHFDDLMAGRVQTRTAFIPLKYFNYMQTRWPQLRRKFTGAMISVRTVDQRKSKYGKPFYTDFDRGGCIANFAGQIAMALCVYMGFAEMFLIGFDANDSEGHFFDKDFARSGPPGFSRKPMREWFTAIGDWDKEHPETTIVNCNPDSAIKELTRKSKQEVMDAIFHR